jgi:hypothetical protein
LGHLVDGIAGDQHWKTTLVVTNPNTDYDAHVRVSFYGNNGNPLTLNFGEGDDTSILLTVPKGGTKVVTSVGASPNLLEGWAILDVIDNPPLKPATPVTASLLYRAALSGNRYWDVATGGTGATFFYSSYGNRDLGVAVANPNSTAINLQVIARNEDGSYAGGPWAVELPPLGHTSWNLNSPPTNLTSFSGSIQITSTDTPPKAFVAVSLNYRDPVISPLPPGETLSPAPYDRRPKDIAIKVRQAQLQLVRLGVVYDYIDDPPATIAPLLGNIGLVVDNGAPLAASYQASDNSVHVSTGLVQALGANDAALAFVIGHMLAHGVMNAPAIGVPNQGMFKNDPELLADSAGAATLIAAGFDPNAMVDFYGRLVWANMQGLPIDNALRQEFSLNNMTGIGPRIEGVLTAIAFGCSASAPLNAACENARQYWHPQNPPNVP